MCPCTTLQPTKGCSKCFDDILGSIHSPSDPTHGDQGGAPAGEAGRSGNTAAGGGLDPLSRALVQNLNAFARQSLENTEREARKKSMKSQLAPDAVTLFTVLCAQDWSDYRPTASVFTEKLMADKNMNKALGIIRTATTEWDGAWSESGITSFLATEYVAPDIDDRPGGFSIFNFRPLSAKQHSIHVRRWKVRRGYGEVLRRRRFLPPRGSG